MLRSYVACSSPGRAVANVRLVACNPRCAPASPALNVVAHSNTIANPRRDFTHAGRHRATLFAFQRFRCARSTQRGRKPANSLRGKAGLFWVSKNAGQHSAELFGGGRSPCFLPPNSRTKLEEVVLRHRESVVCLPSTPYELTRNCFGPGRVCHPKSKTKLKCFGASRIRVVSPTNPGRN